MERKPVLIYTDGSCDGNPGPGGYAAILKCGKFYKEITGKVPHSTINRMELLAVLQGLSEVKPFSNVTVYSDSAYVVSAFAEGRLEQWRRNGWHRIRTGTPVVNRDQWQALCAVIKDRNLVVKFQKLRAHKGNYFNDRADFLARQAAKSA